MRMLLFSDLHLKESNMDVAKKFLDEILKYDFDVLIFLGDFFDSKDRIPSSLMMILFNLLQSLLKMNKKAIFLYGNHDGYTQELSNLNFLKLSQNFLFIDNPKQLSNFLFLPYSEDMEQLQYYIDKSDSLYAFTHVDIKGLLLEDNRVYPKGIDKDRLLKFRHVWSGHIHYPHSISNITVVGNPFALSFKDRSYADRRVERGFCLVDLKQGNLVSNEFRIYRSHYYVKCSSEDELYRLSETYRNCDVHLWLHNVEMDEALLKGVRVLSVVKSKDVESSEEVKKVDVNIKSVKDIFVSLYKGIERDVKVESGENSDVKWGAYREAFVNLLRQMAMEDILGL